MTHLPPIPGKHNIEYVPEDARTIVQVNDYIRLAILDLTYNHLNDVRLAAVHRGGVIKVLLSSDDPDQFETAKRLLIEEAPPQKPPKKFKAIEDLIAGLGLGGK